MKFTYFVTFLIISLSISSTSAANNPFLDEQWEIFKHDHYKIYTSEEDAIRKVIWSEHKIDIDVHNLENSMEWNSYSMKYNIFTDMTVQEINMYTKSPIVSVENHDAPMYKPIGGKLPDSVDWRKSGWVSSVLTQYGCSSDWAIAAVGAIEAQLAKKTGYLIPLSVQDVIDSSENGCNGAAAADDAFKHILARKAGLVKALCKPYLAKRNIWDYEAYKEECPSANISSYLRIATGNEEDLKDAVANYGPVAVSIGLGSGFLSYSGGVYDNSKCSKELTRNVLIVGYGTENDLDYWLVKNSFGKDWGNDGYIKMARNRDNQCGIANRASLALVK